MYSFNASTYNDLGCPFEATSYLAYLIYNYDGLVHRDQILRVLKELSFDKRSAQRSLNRIIA